MGGDVEVEVGIRVDGGIVIDGVSEGTTEDCAGVGAEGGEQHMLILNRLLPKGRFIMKPAATLSTAEYFLL